MKVWSPDIFVESLGGQTIVPAPDTEICSLIGFITTEASIGLICGTVFGNGRLVTLFDLERVIVSIPNLFSRSILVLTVTIMDANSFFISSKFFVCIILRLS